MLTYVILKRVRKQDFTYSSFRQSADEELLRLEDEDDDEGKAEAERGRDDSLLQLHDCPLPIRYDNTFKCLYC